MNFYLVLSKNRKKFDKYVKVNRVKNKIIIDIGVLQVEGKEAKIHLGPDNAGETIFPPRYLRPAKGDDKEHLGEGHGEQAEVNSALANDDLRYEKGRDAGGHRPQDQGCPDMAGKQMTLGQAQGIRPDSKKATMPEGHEAGKSEH